MSETKMYNGGCHCGAVRYEVEADIQSVISCNCSICSKKGYLLTFVADDRFKLISGQDSLTRYQFNKKHIDHLFCSVCGIQSFARGRAPGGSLMVAINVRCLDGVDVTQIPVQQFDGKNL